MNEIPIGGLVAALVVLIILSAFFSGSETALMTLNRYRLRHQAKAGNRGAKRIARLLDRPDRLIGVILLGNNFVNILASAIATVLALRLFGEAGIAIATGVMTIIVLIFAELAPKTLAATRPETLAYPASVILSPLLKLLYPIVWLINAIANWLLRLIGINPDDMDAGKLSGSELRTVVHESGDLQHHGHQTMLVNLLDLEGATVEDIMVPRNEVDGIDIQDDIDDIIEEITTNQYSWMPVYRGTIEDAFGIVQTRKALPLIGEEDFDRDAFAAIVQEPYFIPENTPLVKQMLAFQREKCRVGFVVDEYGEIKGLVTLADILEEIVGEFTTDPGDVANDITRQQDGSYLVDASTGIRALNRAFGWTLPVDGPKTLNGLILEHLETIPSPGTSLRLVRYPIEIVQTTATGVKTIRVDPKVVEAMLDLEEKTEDETA